MKLLAIPFIPQPGHLHEKLVFQPIDIEPWGSNKKPSCNAAFSISHFDTGICISFTITEPVLHAKKRKINGEVHKDNCVEFFIAFDQGAGYYNFEFNCLGSVKAAFGKGRQRRKYIPELLLKSVENDIVAVIDNLSQSKGIRWGITVTLPLAVFCYHDISSLGGLTCRANFAKCGDDLPVPHFLSWVNINAHTPDFHQPSSFGEIRFMKQEVYNSPEDLIQSALIP